MAMATAVSQRLLFSAVGGTLLAAAVWILLQLFPKRDSRTNFAVWFSTLLATALLPLLSFYLEGKTVATERLACGAHGFDFRSLVPVCCLGGDCFGRFGAGCPGDIPGAQVARSCGADWTWNCWLRIYAV